MDAAKSGLCREVLLNGILGPLARKDKISCNHDWLQDSLNTILHLNHIIMNNLIYLEEILWNDHDVTTFSARKIAYK